MTGAAYIGDDDEREAAASVLDKPLSDLIDGMLEHPPMTLAGCQALARCLILSTSKMRDVVRGEVENFDTCQSAQDGWGMVVLLLGGLTSGTITDVNCTDVVPSFIPDAAGAA